MLRALREHDVGGIHTNLAFFRQILEDPEFRAAHLHTGFIEEFFERHTPPQPPPDLAIVAALAAALHTTARKPAAGATGTTAAAPTASPWQTEGRDGLLR